MGTEMQMGNFSPDRGERHQGLEYTHRDMGTSPGILWDQPSLRSLKLPSPCGMAMPLQPWLGFGPQAAPQRWADLQNPQKSAAASQRKISPASFCNAPASRAAPAPLLPMLISGIR